MPPFVVPLRAVLCYRPVSFRDLPPLRVPPGYTVALYCSEHTLGLSTPQGPVDIGSGGTLRFSGCAVETYDSTAAARDASADPAEALARTLVNGQSGSRLQVEHSSLLMPWKVRPAWHQVHPTCGPACPPRFVEP